MEEPPPTRASEEFLLTASPWLSLALIQHDMQHMHWFDDLCRVKSCIRSELLDSHSVTTLGVRPSRCFHEFESPQALDSWTLETSNLPGPARTHLQGKSVKWPKNGVASQLDLKNGYTAKRCDRKNMFVEQIWNNHKHHKQSSSILLTSEITSRSRIGHAGHGAVTLWRTKTPWEMHHHSFGHLSLHEAIPHKVKVPA